MELNGLHMCNELREGGDIDTTDNLEVHKGFTLESMELITYFRFVAEPTGSVLLGDIKMPTELNIETMVGAPKAQEGWAEVIRTCIEIWGGSKGGLKKAVGTELRGVGGIGKVLEQRYWDRTSSLRQLEGRLDGLDSWTCKWFKICHELDHQLYLVLAAMTFWVRTALRTKHVHVLGQMGNTSNKVQVGAKLSLDS